MLEEDELEGALLACVFFEGDESQRLNIDRHVGMRATDQHQ